MVWNINRTNPNDIFWRKWVCQTFEIKKWSRVELSRKKIVQKCDLSVFFVILLSFFLSLSFSGSIRLCVSPCMSVFISHSFSVCVHIYFVYLFLFKFYFSLLQLNFLSSSILFNVFSFFHASIFWEMVNCSNCDCSKPVF